MFSGFKGTRPPTKIVVIVNSKAPKNIKYFCTTLDHTGYYRKFIKAYAQITALMEKMLKKDVTFCSDEEFQTNLDILRNKMVTTPIMVFPDWKKEFHVHVDASYVVPGVMLAQPGEGNIDHLIAFASRKLSKVEKNYLSTECEGLAMVYVLQKF